MLLELDQVQITINEADKQGFSISFHELLPCEKGKQRTMDLTESIAIYYMFFLCALTYSLNIFPVLCL